MKKYLPLILAVMLAAGCSKKHAEETEAAIPVVTAQAVKKTVPVTVTATGTVMPINKVSVASQVDGWIKKIYIKEGQEVKKGDQLMLIDPEPFLQRLEQAKAQLAQDMDSMKFAKIQAKRYEELVQKGAVAQSDADQNLTTYKTALGKVDADKAAVEQSKIDLDYTNITAPLTGKAGGFLVNEGAAVKKSDTALVVINQVAPIYVQFAIPEKMLARVVEAKSKGPLAVTAKPPGGKAVQGVLTFIDNSVNQDTGMIMLKGTFENADRGLWPGQFASVTLVLGEEPDAVVVPPAAVQSSQDGQSVFVLAQGSETVSLRKIVVDRIMGDDCVVAQGLSAGETVVTDGQMLLKDGARVQLKTQAAN